ncbi:MAG: hypothetical protein GTO14_15835 [Anaerolineales bacterium]|nr:hypothetical protein [Anaerolineales bacterium]
MCESSIETDLEEQTIAFSADWEGDYEIYLIQADGSDLRQLTNNERMDIYPRWSPDSKLIAIVTGDLHTPKLTIFNLVGAGEERLVSDLLVSRLKFVWSPVGDHIAFWSTDNIYLVNTSDGSSMNLTSGANLNAGLPSFSSDGKILVFDADILGSDQNTQLFIVEADGADLIEFNYDQGDVDSPMWHPFEDKILFSAWSPKDGYVLYVVSIEGGDFILRIDPDVSIFWPTWSPDGNTIAFVDITSQSSDDDNRRTDHVLWVMNADGTERTIVLDSIDGDPVRIIQGLSWAPDSRYIAFAGIINGGMITGDLFVVDICNGEVDLIAKGVDAVPPSWKPTSD